MSEQARRVPRSEVGELRVTQVSVAVTTPPPQEHHLGDRLAAFVDGELDHGARERVQAHLATCPDCLAEAEEERRLKARLREVLPPEPSNVFLSRLMAISAADDDEGDPRPPQGPPSRVRSLFGGSGAHPGTGFGMSGGLGSGGLRGSSFGNGALGADRPVPGMDPRARRERGREPRGERPIAARLRAGSDPSGPLMTTSEEASARAERAGRTAVVGVAPSAPAAPRGRRLVFAAAGAFSVAAVTLSSALTGVTATSEAPHDVAPLSGSNNYAPSANYAPAGGQLAYNAARVDDARERTAANQHAPLARPGMPPNLYPAAELR
ncbi:anti-sigma factor family protein [Streptacidiphilus neutrinimicus]|uniref:anti-sigma factor family protein n=1 Tax=Streptacidiphilus neutrinimicus TaxID=105420 RepID=UPI00069503A7|nr:zf-HC2 domain-containing protein [Streptacidiphilus neutrinimicus]